MSSNIINAKLSKKMRNWHRILTPWVFLPLLIISLTGSLLLLKKQISWIQPKTIKQEPAGEFINLNSLPKYLGVDWEQIKRLDIRPKHGLVKAQLAENKEIQVSLYTGEVLQVAKRRSDVIESIHDGSFFHPLAKYFIFLPISLILVFLLFSGLYIYLGPLLRKAQRIPTPKPRQRARLRYFDSSAP